MKVFDFLEANGTAYIVMELLSGETLEERIVARRVELADIENRLTDRDDSRRESRR